MKNRLIKDKTIDNYINRLSETVFESRIEEGELITWELFFDELVMNDGLKDIYRTGATAMGIIALCNSNKEDKRYRDTIKKATDLLVKLRNCDGSWSVTANTDNKDKIGIVYNSVIAIQCLIDAGFLNLKETNPNQLTDNLKYIYESIKWIYSQRIPRTESDTQYYGWGYSGDTENKIYIMPTVNVLITLKRVYYELARIWKQKTDIVVDDNKTLLVIINEIQDSLYFFRTSPNGGWGKELNDKEDRIVYTLYGLYGLSYSEKEEEGVNYPTDVLSDEDINLFTDIMCLWDDDGFFDKEYLESLNPEEFFDSYIQRGTDATYEIIDHETFFEAIAIPSVIGFVKRYNKKIRKTSKSQLYRIIVRLCTSLENRTEVININDRPYTVVRSRRGLLSQSYPIYAITQSIIAFLVVKKEKKIIKKLMDFRGFIYKILGFLIQAFALFIVNRVAIPEARNETLVLVSLIAPASEYLKNWIFKLSKLEE